MNEQQPMSPRHRLQALLSIPERLRTDAQWDEINELEIAQASVNRTEAREPNVRRGAPGPSSQPKPNSGTQGKKPARKFHKRPSKENMP